MMARDFVAVQARFTVMVFLASFLVHAERPKGAVSGPDLTEDSCKMIVEMCTTLYTKQLKGENASDKQLCSTLHHYKLCLERSHNSCRGGSTYDTLLTVVSRLLNRLCSEHEESAAA